MNDQGFVLVHVYTLHTRAIACSSHTSSCEINGIIVLFFDGNRDLRYRNNRPFLHVHMHKHRLIGVLPTVVECGVVTRNTTQSIIVYSCVR